MIHYQVVCGFFRHNRRFFFVMPRCAVLLVALSSCLPVVAMTNQVALFTGFNASSGAGMDVLEAKLSQAGIPNYLGRVFEWTEQQDAFDWIQGLEEERSTLVIIGHSFGGNSALQLANDFLKPIQLDVDLTIQVDSVANFGSGWNDLVPTNVDVAISYYQIATSFFEPQGEDNVQGATNINAEVLFNDTSITHTSIDNDSRLHTLISQHVMDNLNFQNGDYNGDGSVDALDYAVWTDSFGSTVNLAADGNSNGTIDAADYTVWRDNASTASATIVPEPSSFLLAALSVALMQCTCSHRKSSSRKV